MPAESAHRAAAHRPGAAQQDAGITGRHAPALGSGRSGCLIGQPRPRKITMEDVAARHPEFGFDVEGRHHLDALFATSIAGEAGLQRFSKYRAKRAQRRILRALPGASWIRREQARRRLHSEQRQSVVARGPQLRIQDRAVGQGMAIDLARQRIRDLTGKRVRVRGMQSGIALAKMQGAGEAGSALSRKGNEGAAASRC